MCCLAGTNWGSNKDSNSRPRAAVWLFITGWVAPGLTNADIAGSLHLSEGTVRNHVSTILAKLQVADRTQAAVISLQHGLGE